MLTGPGEDIRCTCVEVLEDELTETTERFRMRITGDTSLITRDTVDAFIEDNDVGECIMVEWLYDNVAIAICFIWFHFL